MPDAADVLLCLEPRYHYFMTAPHAPKAKIRAGSQNQPYFFPTGVGFFHSQDVADTNFHKDPPVTRGIRPP